VGDDVLVGGAGDDTLTGGAGKDKFVFQMTEAFGFGHDAITDFDSTDDTIEVYSADGMKISLNDLEESVGENGDRVLSTEDGFSSITIDDEYEEAPSIISSSSASSIAENSGAGQVVYTTALADNGDGVTFSLKEELNDDRDAFTINSGTGEVTLTENPDYEANPNYDFTVVATDAAGNSDERAVTLDITDVDEVAPSITSSDTASAIAENSGADQVVYTAEVTDISVVTFSLKDGLNDDRDAFTINSGTGEVTLTENPDYEANPSYGFTVVATDAAGNSAERAVTLGITDVDEDTSLSTPFSVEATMLDGGVASFSVFANVDPGEVGLETVSMTLSHDPSDLQIIHSGEGDTSISAADGFLGLPNYDVGSGVITFAAAAVPSLTDLSKPILSFEADVLDTSEPIGIDITNASLDDIDQTNADLSVDLSDVMVTTEVVGMGGQSLDDVRVAYEIVTPSGQQQMVDLPIAAASGPSGYALERGSGLKVTAERDYDAASEDAVDVRDALEALRMVVGLSKSDGSKAQWHDYLAADIDQSGDVTVRDALSILKAVVGLEDDAQPQWVFIDRDADYTGMGDDSVNYTEGVELESVASEASLGLTGILLGDIDGSYWG